MSTKDAALIAELREKMRAIECDGTKLQDAGHANDTVRAKAPASASDHGSSQGRISNGSADEWQRLREKPCQSGRKFDEESAFQKIERLLNVREHPRAALLQRLVRDGFSEDVAQSAVDRAVRCGLVSDERFADVLVRSRLSQGKGLQGIAAELERFEIEPWSVEAYRMAADGECGPDELARALDVLASKPPRSKRPRDAAFRKLVQKGFGSDVASSAARIWFEEHCREDKIA